MPASSIWLATDAPAQWQLGSPVGPAEGTAGMNTANQSGLDTTLHWKVSGGIILALVIIFGLQAMGFRFVTSANVSIG